jgi:hypothetical protein
MVGLMRCERNFFSSETSSKSVQRPVLTSPPGA